MSTTKRAKHWAPPAHKGGAYTPLLTLVRTGHPNDLYGYERLHVVAFNYDGKGGLLTLAEAEPGHPSHGRLMSWGSGDVEHILGRDEWDGEPYYDAVPPERIKLPPVLLHREPWKVGAWNAAWWRWRWSKDAPRYVPSRQERQADWLKDRKREKWPAASKGPYLKEYGLALVEFEHTAEKKRKPRKGKKASR